MIDQLSKIRMYGLRKSCYFAYTEFLYKIRQVFLNSYSQRGEDLIIDKLVKNKKRGFYVDIGANDPKRFSNTKRFYDKGWRGINIDPNIESINKFKKLRPRDINLNIGISEAKSKIKFYLFFPDTLSTFSKKLAAQYEKEGYKKISEKTIPTLPLSSVLKKNLGKNKIDFMTIDTEGYDEIILKSNNWIKYSPKIICVESNKSDDGQRLKKFLLGNKYVLKYDNGLNSIYALKL